MFCFNEFAFTVQVKHKINSNKFLALFWYVCILWLAISIHVYFAKNVAYFPFNSWLSFQRLCRLLWGFLLNTGNCTLMCQWQAYLWDFHSIDCCIWQVLMMIPALSEYALKSAHMTATAKTIWNAVPTAVDTAANSQVKTDRTFIVEHWRDPTCTNDGSWAWVPHYKKQCFQNVNLCSPWWLYFQNGRLIKENTSSLERHWKTFFRHS